MPALCAAESLSHGVPQCDASKLERVTDTQSVDFGQSVHAIFPNAQHVTLWCQAGFRKCANLAPGTYQVEPDGDKAVRIYVYSIVSHKLMGKMKYRVIGSW
jgi:hypothetical protein